MRLFVAVNLPDAEKARLGTVLGRLQDTPLPVRWTDPDALHITMKFLGEIAEERRGDLTAALARAVQGLAPFDVEIAGFGAFPSNSRPRILWIGVQAPPQLRALHEGVEREFEALGFAREVRDFSPHLTLGRVKSTSRLDRNVVDKIAPSPEYQASIRVESIDLMRSHLGADRAHHELLARVPLNALGA